MLCVIDVYLRGITNTICVILHLNVSHLSVCYSCLLLLSFVDVFIAVDHTVILCFALIYDDDSNKMCTLKKKKEYMHATSVNNSMYRVVSFLTHSSSLCNFGHIT